MFEDPPPPIEMLIRLSVGLKAGKVPRDVAEWFAPAVDQFLRRGAPLAHSLGLSAPRGKWPEAPRNKWRIDYRDSLYRLLATYTDGNQTERALAVGCWIEDAKRLTRDRAGFDREFEYVPLVRALLRELLDLHLPARNLPTSVAQVSRILSGRRS